ncbi:MAG: hypothetical protein ABFR89_05325 [Actinomycetota bacterium]
METQLDVILRRLEDVPPAKGNGKVGVMMRSAGPGISYYQRRSAHLRDRDCSVELRDADMFGIDLTKG